MIKPKKIVALPELKREGLSISAIARRTGMDRKTVRKLLDRGLTAPAYAPRIPMMKDCGIKYPNAGQAPKKPT